MPFTLIKGTFHVVGKEPDGDSIRFLPDNPTILASLPGNKSKLAAGQSVQLRMEAIDATEIHYTQGLKALNHQPDGLAFAARDFLLKELGITVTKWGGARSTRAVAAQDGTRGYILSRSFEPNGRPVSFVYAGNPAEKDGAQVQLTVARLRKSANHKLARTGLAYPTYYDGLFYDLRNEFTAVCKAARKRPGQTVWKGDLTVSGAAVSTVQKAVTLLVDTSPILPKLFRRVATYYKEPNVTKMTDASLRAYLRAHPDPVLYLPKQNFTRLDTFVKVENGKLRLTVQPEDLVFQENAKVSKARGRSGGAKKKKK